VNVRGANPLALATVEDLRRIYDGQYYVSDPYDLEGAWVFALCRRCVGPARRSPRGGSSIP
jgi:hypothetical protein